MIPKLNFPFPVLPPKDVIAPLLDGAAKIVLCIPHGHYKAGTPVAFLGSDFQYTLETYDGDFAVIVNSLDRRLVPAGEIFALDQVTEIFMRLVTMLN